jgi:aflatoxin B1 aldehyde reductase
MQHKLILGTMTFGPQVNPEEAKKMVHYFLEQGFTEIDSAFVYNEGQTEEILGEILPELFPDAYSLATKVNPRITGVLDAAAVTMQLEKSLERLQLPAVDLLYLHFPDPKTPLAETLEACARLHEQGKFRALGLSNFPSWMVVEAWHLCQKNGWPLPEVYQGLYNGLSRNVEAELFPALRHLGIRFYAYNPLAGGLLSGKYTNFTDPPAHGRFTLRPNYQNRYWKPSFFAAVEVLATTCKEYNISLAAAGFRWLAFHSQLDPHAGDGIILGASKFEQVEQNILALSEGELPLQVLEAFEKAWEEARPESPAYFRLPKE